MMLKFNLTCWFSGEQTLPFGLLVVSALRHFDLELFYHVVCPPSRFESILIVFQIIPSMAGTSIPIPVPTLGKDMVPLAHRLPHRRPRRLPPQHLVTMATIPVVTVTIVVTLMVRHQVLTEPHIQVGRPKS